MDLLVRGICCLRPGVEGISENICVRSVLGRYLEHSRIFYFENGGKEEIYLGSADLMQRNLNHRVEEVFPVEDPDYVKYLRTHVLEAFFRDERHTRVMQSDGSYERLAGKETEEVQGVQEWLMRNPWKRKTKSRPRPRKPRASNKGDEQQELDGPQPREADTHIEGKSSA